MSVLSACASAAIRLRGKKVTSVFSTDPFSIELGDLATEAARAIVDEHDWQALTKLCTLNGTGSAETFALPVDYKRMLKKGDVHSTTWQTARYLPADDLDDWLEFQGMAISGTPGRWIITGGEMGILPAMPVGETARFHYISRNITSGGKAQFEADADEFVLDERLLTLAVIWRWRAQKRLEYAEDLRNYELALNKAIASDRGQRPLSMSGRRKVDIGDVAFPGTITP